MFEIPYVAEPKTSPSAIFLALTAAAHSRAKQLSFYQSEAWTLLRVSAPTPSIITFLSDSSESTRRTVVPSFSSLNDSHATLLHTYLLVLAEARSQYTVWRR